MIRIKPQPENQFLCPKCSHLSEVREIVLQPVFTIADCVCKNCGFEFYQTLPIGHTTIDTLTIDKSEGKLYPANTQITWLTEALQKALHNKKNEEVQIKKIVHKKHDQVIILNALDFLYGHVLLKLYNSIHHLDNHNVFGLIIIIPKSFEWLVPSGCAEVWIVDLKLSELTYFYSSIQKSISKELERFSTIYLSKACSHPDFTTIDISRFTGITPFDLSTFTKLTPVITFVLREDRWWLHGPVDYWFYRICRKLKITKSRNHVLSMRQNELVRKTILFIRKKMPDANFCVVGLGTTGSFVGHALDERRNN